MVEEADVPGVNHLSQANDKHYQIMLYQVHLAMSGIRTHDFSSWLWVAARKDATEPRVPISYVEVITLKVLDSRPYVCHGYVPFVLDSRPYVWHGYVPFIVIIIRSFPKSWHITRYVTRITLRVQHVE
jgi:hypothetical protein